MREILFRGKTDKGEWEYGDLLIKGFDFETAIRKLYEYKGVLLSSVIKVIPETIGQYTGLTDKNGNKIFEGDIVLFEDESPSNYEYHDCTEMRCGSIEYGDNCFYITDRIAVEMEDLIYDGKLDVEVIGNIHDNKLEDFENGC